MYYKNSGGYTLIEVLASIVILSIILISFFGFITQGFIFSGKNKDNLVSSNLASNVLETVQKNYSNTETSQSDCNTDIISKFNDLHNGVISMNNRTYYAEARLVCEDGDNNPDTSGLNIIHVKIYDSPAKVEKDLLEESFGYVSE